MLDVSTVDGVRVGDRDQRVPANGAHNRRVHFQTIMYVKSFSVHRLRPVVKYVPRTVPAIEQLIRAASFERPVILSLEMDSTAHGARKGEQWKRSYDVRFRPSSRGVCE